MPHAVPFSTLADWAAAVAALPAKGPLPQRTVLVPSERHAHALRRELARTSPAALAGTRFVSAATAAVAVLESAGAPFTEGEEALRPARILALFREELALEHLDLELLRSTLGWDEAIASAIADLEAAGLSPANLPGDEPLLRDLAALWSRVDHDAGSSWTAARIQLEAAALLVRDPAAWPFRGPTLAHVNGHETVAAARLLAAIPGRTFAVRRLRPLHDRDLARIRALFGDEVSSALATAAPRADAPACERDLLATYLFERPHVVADPARPRSTGRDGTVDLEEHAGVESEVEAAADWVARKVLEGVALEEIAVLVASRDPLAQLVADRVQRLELGGALIPVHVAGGLPATGTSAGARILSATRALSSFLSAEALAPVLAAVRLDGDGDRGHLRHGEALEVAYSLGTVGGNAANPRGALDWSARAAARVGELEAALRRARTDEDSSAREIRRLERTLRNVAAVRPALDALVGVARAIVENAPLSAVGELVAGFVANWLLLPGEGATLAARLREAIAPACTGGLGDALRGTRAIDVVEDRLLALRIPHGRFGQPAVFVGPVASAGGLHFRAVRIVGLCEGVLPSVPHENPVLPERVRERLEAGAPGRVLPRAVDRVSAQAHALFAAMTGARDELVLSAPRVDGARTEREPSAVFVEAAAAIARPDVFTGAAAEVVPNGTALARDYFAPARAAAAEFRAAHPVSERAWLALAAGGTPVVPPSWSAEPSLALDRIAALAHPAGPLGPGDGVLGGGAPFPDVPGLVATRPISASALQQLLQCPRMFFMRRILGWDDPATAPSLRELDALSYGSLLHRVVEEFYRAHGEAFVRREKTPAHWRKTAFALADRIFDASLSEYPLVGEGVRAKERERLKDSLREFLDYDWRRPGARRFVGVELGFGQAPPLELKAGDAKLHLHGFIDRVDEEDSVTVVRDLKSGKAHPRQDAEKDPTPCRDVQLGVYVLAAKKLAPAWKTPKKVVAAYAYADGHADVEERAFREDVAALEDATGKWLATAGALLSARTFPSTPDVGDCEYCPFRPLCGKAAAIRSAAALEGTDGALGAFRVLKSGEDEQEEDAE